MQVNRELGNPDYAPTPLVDAWLGRVFGRRLEVAPPRP
jgi:hypothetical protein